MLTFHVYFSIINLWSIERIEGRDSLGPVTGICLFCPDNALSFPCARYLWSKKKEKERLLENERTIS